MISKKRDLSFEEKYNSYLMEGSWTQAKEDLKPYEHWNMDGVLKLVTDIFKNCSKTYIIKYRYFKKHEQFYYENINKVKKWQKYEEERKAVERILEKVNISDKMNAKQKKRLETFKNMPVPRKPKDETIDLIIRLDNARGEIISIDSFIHSERAQIFSKGRLNPDVFIETCKQKALKE